MAKVQAGEPEPIGVEVVHTRWIWASIPQEYHHAATEVDEQAAPAGARGAISITSSTSRCGPIR